MLNKSDKKFNNYTGFTLVEIAIVIMISGFVMLMAAQFIKLYTINSQREKTMDNLRITQGAIDEFFGLNGRYPCPADPTLASNNANYGLEQCRNITNLTNNQNNCTGTPLNLSCTVNFSRDGDLNGSPDVVMMGIIPFRTLAWSIVDTPYFENHRLDGYSTYISYAVTEHMSDSTKHNLINPANPNTGGIRVEDENNVPLTIPDASAHYVVYSHGENKKGGYSSSGSMIDNCFVVIIAGDPPALPDPGPGPSGGGIDVDIENCDNNDAIFIKGIRSLGDNDNYNDDVLFFKSTGLSPLWRRSLSSPMGQSYIYNTNLGNVGVGTTSPTHKLHVAGDISAEVSTIATSYCDGVGTDCLLPNAISGTGSNCSDPKQVAYAIQNNQIVCRNVDWVMPAQTCPLGQYLSAISNTGTIICNVPP